MEPQEKLDRIAELATPLFTDGKNKEQIAEQLIINGITSEGFGFTEVFNLVVRVGKNGGFIKTPEQLKEDCKAAVDAKDLKEVNTFELLEEYIESLITTHGTPKKWTADMVKAAFTAKGLTVPKKSTLTDWQRATIDAFLDNVNLSRMELDEVIKKTGVQNYSHYGNLVHGLCSTLLGEYIEKLESVITEAQETKKGDKKK